MKTRRDDNNNAKERCDSQNIAHMLCFHTPYIRRTHLCPFGTFRCDDDTCVSDAYRCDGLPDCINAEDESMCPGTLGADLKYFHQKNTQLRSFPIALVCMGHAFTHIWPHLIIIARLGNILVVN